MTTVLPPRTESELLERAEALSGMTAGELAEELGVTVPSESTKAKGLIGTWLERALGADAGSRAEPDFRALGVELKSVPVDSFGKPTESTFVCSIELDRIGDSEWRQSRVYSKLARVLWFPVEGARGVVPRERRLGRPLLWSPSVSDEALLRADWEALVLLVGSGRSAEVTGHLGVALQVRPKAARGNSTRLALDVEGGIGRTQPKGFYLRPSFTEQVLRVASG